MFSFVNLLVFGVVLAWYDLTIFGVFMLGSLLYFGWIVIFLKRRKDLDYKRFSQLSAEQTKVIELISGMQEIKLHNAEQQKRWSWDFVRNITSFAVKQNTNNADLMVLHRYFFS